MKKIVFVLIALIATSLSSVAADLTEVWGRILKEPGLMVENVDGKRARQVGFEALSVALNSDPTSEAIAAIEKHAKLIDEKQKIASVTEEGVNVSIFATPTDAAGTFYNMLFVITCDAEEKVLVCLYGKCTREQMAKALKDMSIENIIGG